MSQYNFHSIGLKYEKCSIKMYNQIFLLSHKGNYANYLAITDMSL